MGAAARSWDHPRWRYDETDSAAARRSAARMAERTIAAPARPEPRVRRDVGRVKPHSNKTHVRPVVEIAPAHRSALRVVRQPRVRFGPIVVLVAILGAALLAPVGLNLAGVRSQFQVAQLQQRVDDLVAERSTLKAEHAALSSTQRVKETADRLGMVTPHEVGFIALDGPAAGDAAASAVVVANGAGDDTGDGLIVASMGVGSGR